MRNDILETGRRIAVDPEDKGSIRRYVHQLARVAGPKAYMADLRCWRDLNEDMRFQVMEQLLDEFIDDELFTDEVYTAGSYDLPAFQRSDGLTLNGSLGGLEREIAERFPRCIAVPGDLAAGVKPMLVMRDFLSAEYVEDQPRPVVGLQGDYVEALLSQVDMRLPTINEWHHLAFCRQFADRGLVATTSTINSNMSSFIYRSNVCGYCGRSFSVEEPYRSDTVFGTSCPYRCDDSPPLPLVIGMETIVNDFGVRNSCCNVWTLCKEGETFLRIGGSILSRHDNPSAIADWMDENGRFKPDIIGKDDIWETRWSDPLTWRDVGYRGVRSLDVGV